MELKITEDNTEDSTNDDNNSNRMPISIQLYIKNKISQLSEDHCKELFNIIKKKTNMYTVNSNGVFINLKNQSNEVLNDIKQYVDYIETINKKLSEDRF
jgi:hypothetical protein